MRLCFSSQGAKQIDRRWRRRIRTLKPGGGRPSKARSHISRRSDGPGFVSVLLDLTLDQMSRYLNNLRYLTKEAAAPRPERSACNLLYCPRLQTYAEVIRTAVAVLERTKSSFKSRELGDLRRRLESVLERADPIDPPV